MWLYFPWPELKGCSHHGLNHGDTLHGRTSGMPRRDRHKVYAAADFQDERQGRGDIAPLAVSTADALLDSSPIATSRSQQVGQMLCTGGSVGARADDRSRRYAGAAGILGSIGPGAEPPVAVASRAFAHEEPRTEGAPDWPQGFNQGKEGAPLSYNSLGGEVMSTDVGGGVFESFDRCDQSDPSQKQHSGKEDAASSRPESIKTNNEGEVDTLPDSFNLSDEYGLEGASTGRNHRDREDDDDVKHSDGPRFLGLSIDTRISRRNQTISRAEHKSSSRRYWKSNTDDDGSTSGFQARGEKDGGIGSVSVSDSSDCWPASSGRQKNVFFGRRIPQSSRLPSNAMQNYLRIAPLEDFEEACEFENGGARRHRRASSRNSAKHRSPPPRRHRRATEYITHQRRRRRIDGRQKSRGSRRLELTETESLSGEVNHRVEAEMAELRRENEALKQQQKRTSRLSDGGFDVGQWNNKHDPEGHFGSLDSPHLSGRRHDHARQDARHRERLTRENEALRAQQQLRNEQGQRLLSFAHGFEPPEMDVSPIRSYSRRRRDAATSRPTPESCSDFVRGNLSPRSVGPKGWGNESSGNTTNGIDLSLPRVLVEGGFLWKFPYHNVGTPKRRWFQVKPAEGLLTTASGRLVVRPTAGGGGGSGMCGREADRGNESSRAGGGDKVAAPSMPMMRLRAAWPLTFIWVDPERDLKRSPPREIVVEEIVDLARGHKTPAFWQQASHRGIHTLPDPKLCFSLVGHDRSLDLAAESLTEAREWVCALAGVALMAKRGGLVEAAGDAVAPLLPHRFWPEPAASPAGPDLEESMSGERLNDVDHEVDSHVGVQRQSDRAATALNTDVSGHEVSLRSDADLSSEIPKVFGEGGEWSVDTIHAWRRRLFPAVRRGDIAAVLAIFDQGCPVDIAQTGTGDTPMLLACRLGDVGMVRECLRRGARNDPHPAFGQTALQAAVASGQEACTRLILETAAPSRSDAVVSNHKDPNKETPLHVACRRGYDGIVEALLHHGADLRAVDKKGNTPLHGAAGSGHTRALGSLLDAGGDVVLEERNARGDRALHTAAAPGHIACVELLLGTAAEPDVPNADGQTPFALASRGGHLAVTRLIRKYAPAAGTPSGGDAQFQAHRRANEGGRSTTADTLPRPHSSGSASNPPGTPDHRSRDLEHRCYSAAGLGHEQFQDLNDSTSYGQPVYTSGGDSSDRDLLRSTSEHDRRGLDASGGELQITKATPPQSTVVAHVTSPASSTSAPVQGSHGSLFDGLQVYVVGGRQPLGSQHSCAAHGKMSASLARVAVSARTMVLDSHRLSTASHHHQVWEEQQQQHRNYYPSNQQSSYNSSLSTASFEGLDPNWRDNILSAPSTVAPSPPTPVLTPEDDRRPNRDSTSLLSAFPSTASTIGGDGTGIVGVVGSARALARMIHFNSTNDRGESEISSRGLAASSSAMRTQNLTEKEIEEPHGGTAASGKSGGGETMAEPIGCWMTPVDDDQDTSGVSSRAPEVGGKGHGCGTDQTSTSGSPRADAAEFFGSHVDTEPALGRGTSRTGATADQEAVEIEESEKEGDSFVIVASQEMGGRQTRDASAALAGLWKVFQSEGYPYYLHEASGHTQWEDPREMERLRVREFSADTGVTADVLGEGLGECSEPNGGAALLEEHLEEENGGLSDKTPIEREQPPSSASPIKPAGVPVAVKVARFVEAAATSRTVAITPHDLKNRHTAAPSEFGEGDQELSQGLTDVDAVEDNFDRVGLVGATTTLNDNSSIDSCIYGSACSTSDRRGCVDNKNTNSSSSSGSSGSNNGTTSSNGSDIDQNTGNDSGDDRLSHIEDEVAGPDLQRSTDRATTKESRRRTEKDTGDDVGTKQRDQAELDVSWPSLPQVGAERTAAFLADGVQGSKNRSPDASAHGSVSLGIVDKGKVNGSGGVDCRRTERRSSNLEGREEWWQELDDDKVTDTKNEGELLSS